MRRILDCAVAGLIATAPMTAWMLATQRLLLPPRERTPLPPETITAHAAEAAGLDAVAGDRSARRAATLVNHFAYGAAAATLYAPALDAPAPALLKGAALGALVWTGSYLGLLPALGLLEPATRHPPRRNAQMILAHLIWGGATALIAEGRARRTPAR